MPSHPDDCSPANATPAGATPSPPSEPSPRPADEPEPRPADEEGRAAGTSSIDPAVGAEPTTGSIRICALRALRLGFLLATAGAYLMDLLLYNSVRIGGVTSEWIKVALPIAGIAWLIGLFPWYSPSPEDTDRQRRRDKATLVGVCVVLATVVASCAIATATLAATQWLLAYELTGINVGEMVAFALASLNLGAFLVTDLILRYVYQARPDLVPPRRAGWRRRTTARARANPGRPRRRGAILWTRLGLVAVTLTPVVLLGSAPAALQAALGSANHLTIEQPAPDPLPTTPGALAAEAAWTLEVEGLLDIAPGAAGPVILTPNGMTALNPDDGSTLWNLERQGAVFESVFSSAYRLRWQRTYLVTSPDNRYVAVRIKGPGRVIDGAEKMVVLTVDTLTGEVTGEHVCREGPVQVSDSAVLCNRTAYSLADGSMQWGLTSTPEYSGTGGHASFILSVKMDEYVEGWGWSSTITVIPDDIRRGSVSVPGVMTAQQGDPLVVDGWVGVFTNGTPLPTTGSPHEGWPVHATCLDRLLTDLLGPDEANCEEVDLGRSVAINAAASVAANDLVVLPAAIPPRQEDFGPRLEEWTETSTVGAVFDPDTLTVTPPDQTAGLAAARIGVAFLDDSEAVAPALVIQPGDGSQATTIPLDPTALPDPPGDIHADNAIRAGLSEVAVVAESFSPLSAVNTPGASVVLLDVSPFHNWYAWSKGSNWGTNRTYRLYGVTGASS